MKKWIIFYAGVPLVFKLCMPDGRVGLWPLILIDMFLMPLSFVFLNAIVVLKIRLSMFFASSFSLIGIIIGNSAGYIRWGIASGNLFTPDGATIWIVEKLLIYQICFVAVGLAIIFFAKIGKKFLYKRRADEDARRRRC